MAVIYCAMFNFPILCLIMGISILQWNCNGIRARSNELKQYLSSTDVRYDILCLQETFLKEGHSFNLLGYRAIRKDRPDAAKGGLITFVQDSLNITVLDDINADGIEALAVKVKTRNGDIVVINCYHPPQKPITSSSLEKLFFSTNTIITGDFNAKNTLWGSPIVDRFGAEIEEMLSKNNFVCVNTGAPTRQNYNGTMSHIDVTFTSKTLGSKCTWGVINNCMGSDHLPTYTKVCEAPFLEPNPEPKFRMQTANWVDFKEGCKIHLAQQLANSDIDTFAHSVQHAIITAAELAIKVAKPGNRNKRAKQLPYWNDQITSAVKQRNKARNKANRSRLPNDCDNYRLLKGQCQRLIKSTAKQHWHDYCSNLNSSAKLSTVWAMSLTMNGVDSNKSIHSTTQQPNLRY